MQYSIFFGGRGQIIQNSEDYKVNYTCDFLCLYQYVAPKRLHCIQYLAGDTFLITSHYDYNQILTLTGGFPFLQFWHPF